MAHENLRTAKKAKKDEFYTQLKDIEVELHHYREYFKNKIIFCNCDDPYESNFFKYFAMNFNQFQLKKLIATCYSTSPIVYTQLNIFGEEEVISADGNGRKAYKIEIEEVTDENGDGAVDLADVETLLKNKKNLLTMLEGNGDFRSDECIKLLDECDIVCTIPPFSLFRDYISLMEEKGKDFIIIGNTNALTYKETFRMFKEDKIRTGYTNFNVGMFFVVPDDVEKFHKINEEGKKLVRVSNSCWFTSLPVSKHNEMLIPHKRYNESEYPKYENFDAINVNTYTDIPDEYDGIMGVPITFLDKYNPKQFELIGLGISNSGIEVGVQPYKPEHKKYRKEVQKRGAVDGDLYMMKNGIVDVPYARILIRRRG